MNGPARRRWHHRVRHSLRARLVLLFVALAVGTTLVFVAGTREAFTSGWRELVRPLAVDYVDRLAAEIGDPPDLARAQALARRLPVSITIRGPVVQWQSHVPRHEPPDGVWRTLLTRRTSDGHEIRFGLDAWRWHEDRPRMVGWLTLAGLLALTALAYGTVRHLFRPLDDIRDGARRYESGDFSSPIPARRHDELGELAEQVNAMAQGLKRMLEGQRGLLLAISHELRSPLTRARLHAELLAEGPERDALLRDLGLMRQMIADLLEGERLASGSSALVLSQTDLNALVREVIEGQFEGQAIALDLDEALKPFPLDAARVALAVRNLVDNALRHGAGGPPPIVSTRAGASTVTLKVRDHGPGVAPEQLGRLTEPFYRPDAARTRERGGVGLGLYLCRLVAQSHGGRLELAAAEPGLAVALVLPLARGERT